MNRNVAPKERYRALQSLRAADLLSREDCHEDAVFRAYHAVFHAAKAALQIHDVTTTSHPGVRRMFGKHLVLAGQIESKRSKYLARDFDGRLMADYDVKSSFSIEEARLECRRAGEFIERIRQYLPTMGFTKHELESELGRSRDNRHSRLRSEREKIASSA